jgi:hypothetical protein
MTQEVSIHVSMNEKISDNAGVIAFPPALYGVTLAIGLVISFMFPVSFLGSPGLDMLNCSTMT